MNLSHPNTITLWIKALKGAGIQIELITKNHDEVADRGNFWHRVCYDDLSHYRGSQESV
jgi:NAD-dependent SIR2 family protein deacetylase